MESTKQQMKVEIWSDVMCPFCYIGKRKFERALDQFSHKEDVQVIWKSFQLDPSMKTDPSQSVIQLLAEKKGWSLEQSKQMSDHVTNLAKQVGLTYHFDKAVAANSFDAHRLSHLAARHNLQDAAEERLFAAYFTEGENTADHETLVRLGTDIGLDAAEVRTMLAGDEYSDDVHRDMIEAQRIGARGVPFFVLSSKYAVSGAQESATFAQALDRSWQEWQKEIASAPINIADGATCSPEGCE
jgi:predicted DsbA family dithiol-disulfide isomerase